MNSIFHHSPVPRVVVAFVAVALLLGAGSGSRGGGTGGPPVGGGGSNNPSPPPDILATIPAGIFSRPAVISRDTRLWSNRALAAAGGTTVLPGVSRINIDCQYESDQTLMTLRITSLATGEVRFEQTTQVLRPPSPARMMRLNIPASGNRVQAFDGTNSLEIPLPEDALAVLRRAGDIWSPMLTALGQFDSIVDSRPATFNDRACIALTLGKPRLPGLESGTLYVDATTFLPVGQETNVVRDILISGRTTILQWQTVSGIQVPQVIRIEGSDGNAVLRFTNVSFVSGSPLGG